MADIVIFLGTKTINGITKLTLRDTNGADGTDNIDTKVHGGDNIYWIIDNDQSIDSFSIQINDDSKEFLSIEPFQISSSQWGAVIKGDLENGVSKYTISYTKDNKTYSTDPDLIILPPQKDK